MRGRTRPIGRARYQNRGRTYALIDDAVAVVVMPIAQLEGGKVAIRIEVVAVITVR